MGYYKSLLLKTRFLHILFQMATVDGVQTHMLMAVPAPHITQEIPPPPH